MELRQLRYFVAVAEELNFTKAARRMQIAQPPLSRQIRDLEREIGVRLFERNSARVFLTDAGNRFLNEAHAVLRNAARAIEVARQAKTGESGTVRIGIAKGLGEVVSRVINRHLRLLPGVEIDVQDIASGFQSEALVTGRIDVGFLRPPTDTTKLSSEPLFAERFSVVLPRSSPLAKHKHLRLKHLVDQRLLLIDRPISSGAYDKTLDLIRNAGLSANIVPTQTIVHDEAGAILVDSGKGIYIAVGRNPYHPAFADRLIALPLMEPGATIEVHIVWRKKEQTKVALDFIAFTRKVLSNLPPVIDMTHDLERILGDVSPKQRIRQKGQGSRRSRSVPAKGTRHRPVPGGGD